MEDVGRVAALDELSQAGGVEPGAQVRIEVQIVQREVEIDLDGEKVQERRYAVAHALGGVGEQLGDDVLDAAGESDIGDGQVVVEAEFEQVHIGIIAEHEADDGKRVGENGELELRAAGRL